MDYTNDVTPPLPEPSSMATEPDHPSPPLSLSSSASASGSESEQAERRPRPIRTDRPKLGSRKTSASIVVHKSHPQLEISNEIYPPDDARAMSPRRNSEDLEKLGKEARASLQEQAKTLQSSLQALADRIDEVRSDHDKLESENKFLQDYIGGLTRTMSKGDLGSSGKSSGKSRK